MQFHNILAALAALSAVNATFIPPVLDAKQPNQNCSMVLKTKQNSGLHCGEVGPLDISRIKALGQPSSVPDVASCAGLCQNTSGCISFDASGNQCQMFSKTLVNMGIALFNGQRGNLYNIGCWQRQCVAAPISTSTKTTPTSSACICTSTATTTTTLYSGTRIFKQVVNATKTLLPATITSTIMQASPATANFTTTILTTSVVSAPTSTAVFYANSTLTNALTGVSTLVIPAESDVFSSTILRNPWTTTISSVQTVTFTSGMTTTYSDLFDKRSEPTAVVLAKGRCSCESTMSTTIVKSKYEPLTYISYVTKYTATETPTPVIAPTTAFGGPETIVATQTTYLTSIIASTFTPILNATVVSLQQRNATVTTAVVTSTSTTPVTKIQTKTCQDFSVMVLSTPPPTVVARNRKLISFSEPEIILTEPYSGFLTLTYNMNGIEASIMVEAMDSPAAPALFGIDPETNQLCVDAGDGSGGSYRSGQEASQGGGPILLTRFAAEDLQVANATIDPTGAVTLLNLATGGNVLMNCYNALDLGQSIASVDDRCQGVTLVAVPVEDTPIVTVTQSITTTATVFSSVCTLPLSGAFQLSAQLPSATLDNYVAAATIVKNYPGDSDLQINTASVADPLVFYKDNVGIYNFINCTTKYYLNSAGGTNPGWASRASHLIRGDPALFPSAAMSETYNNDGSVDFSQSTYNENILAVCGGDSVHQGGDLAIANQGWIDITVPKDCALVDLFIDPLPGSNMIISVPIPEPTSPAPLLINGDFEIPDGMGGFSAWTSDGYGTISPVVYDDDYDQSAQLQCQSENSIGISQTFSTTQGQVYSVSYDYYAINGYCFMCGFNGDSTAEVDIFDATSDESSLIGYSYFDIGENGATTDGNGNSNDQGTAAFHPYNALMFTATSDSTTIRIGINCYFNDRYSFAQLVVDNVVVTQLATAER